LATINPAQKSGNRYADLKKRLLFLLGALVVYRIGTHIPVPGINASVLDELFKSQQGGILGLFNVFSGGALSRFSIFALGIMPYISASIIFQLLGTVLPSLQQLGDQLGHPPETHALATAARLRGQGRGDVRLSSARVAQQDDRLSAVDELAAHQFGDQHLVKRRLGREVEVLQRLEGRETRRLQAPFGRPPLAVE